MHAHMCTPANMQPLPESYVALIADTEALRAWQPSVDVFREFEPAVVAPHPLQDVHFNSCAANIQLGAELARYKMKLLKLSLSPKIAG